jgi:hypothetical protein
VARRKPRANGDANFSLPLSQTSDGEERSFVPISTGSSVGSHLLRLFLRRQEEEEGGTPIFCLSHVARVRLLVSNVGISKVVAMAWRIMIQKSPLLLDGVCGVGVEWLCCWSTIFLQLHGCHGLI